MSRQVPNEDDYQRWVRQFLAPKSRNRLGYQLTQAAAEEITGNATTAHGYFERWLKRNATRPEFVDEVLARRRPEPEGRFVAGIAALVIGAVLLLLALVGQGKTDGLLTFGTLALLFGAGLVVFGRHWHAPGAALAVAAALVIGIPTAVGVGHGALLTSRNAEREIPIVSGASVTDGSYEATAEGPAVLRYNAEYQETSLEVILTDTERYSPQLQATVEADGDELHCEMFRGHLTSGSSITETLTCDGVWKKDDVRRATGVSLSSYFD